MGNDEHGPAYPEPPSDRDALMAAISEGKRTEYMEVFEPTDMPLWLRMVIVVFVVGCLLFLFTKPAPAMNHGFDPGAKETKWFESLIRPDQPPNSCCGKGDAYPVARYEKINERGDYRIWLADGSAIKYPDGTTRDPFDVSVPIEVPFNKVNKLEDDLDNPTDVSWVFMRVSTFKDVGTLYCFIRHPEGN